MIRFSNLLRNKEIFFKIIVTFVTIIVLSTFLKPAIRYGEYPSAILPTYSILYSGSLTITDKELDLAAKDMPALFGENFSGSLFRTANNEQYGFYTPIYNIISIPSFILCKVLGINMLYYITLVNLMMMFIACMFILFVLKIDLLYRIMLLLLILMSPITNYYIWASSEVYIYSMVTIALVYFFNKNYKTSIALITLTACSQPTLLGVAAGFLMIYLLSLYDTEKSFYKNIINNKINIIKGLVSFSPIIPYWIYIYVLRDGQLISTTYQQMSSHSEPFRFLYDYLFSLDFGLLPYIPLILVFSFIIFLKSIIDRNYKSIIYFLSVLLFMFGYSLHYHINCGYTQIHRYTSFTIPFFLFYFIIYHDMFKTKWMKSMQIVIVVLSLTLFIFYKFVTNEYVFFSYQVKYILNNYPSLYNPQPSTFNSKVNHIDGGYNIPGLIVYSDDSHNVRKILVNKRNFNTSNILNYFYGDNESINYLQKKYNSIKNEDDVYYLNIPKKYSIKYVPIKEQFVLDEFIPFNSNKLLLMGFYYRENTHVWGYKNNYIFFKYYSNKYIDKIILDATTYGEQRIIVYLNNTKIFDKIVNFNGILEIKNIQNIKFNKDINILEIFTPNPVMPDNGDPRKLSVALRALKITESLE